MASKAQPMGQRAEANGYGKRMSSHIAYALVVYTLALIFEVSPMIKGSGMAIWPYFLLVVLVGLVILPLRNFEKRWQLLEVNGEGDLSAQFKREVTGLWLCAVGFPTALMAIIWIIP